MWKCRKLGVNMENTTQRECNNSFCKRLVEDANEGTCEMCDKIYHDAMLEQQEEMEGDK